MTTTTTARGSYLGYSYQALCALWSILKLDDNIAISLERYDDVSFEENGKPIELLQTKHHINKKPSLTNNSEDLWKTLGNWSEDYYQNKLYPNDTRLTLITSTKAPEGSVAFYLRMENRKVNAALSELEKIAKDGKDKGTKNSTHYQKFLKLGSYRMFTLINNVVIMDDEPIITDLIEKIKKKLSGFVPAKYQDVLVNQLLGWWERKVVAHLKGESTSPIPRNEVQAQITDIILQCRDDNLPIFSEFDPSEGDAISNEKNFVRQLHIIDKGDKTKKHAKRNYYLASKHRSEWVRIDPLIKRDIERYNKTLTLEWEAKYEDMMDNVGDRTSEKTKKHRGSELFEWANDKTDYLCIRPLCRDPFVRRGTFHILSDDLQIGWHPDFRKHLN